jgi:integrase
MGARALEFTILTAARTSEALGSVWSEIDLAGRLWTIPARRTKGGRQHRVPLSSSAMALLAKVAPLRTEESPDAFVFPSGQPKRPLSIMAMTMTLRRMKRGDITVHGFRSSFRNWAGEATTTPREVAEAALAHTLGNKTEAAYFRGDFFEKRQRLMDEWGAFCSTPLERAADTAHLEDRS